MPRKKSGNFDQAEYVKGYINANIRYKRINFNLTKQEDIDMIKWLDSQPEGVSNYLKRLVEADMKKA